MKFNLPQICLVLSFVLMGSNNSFCQMVNKTNAAPKVKGNNLNNLDKDILKWQKDLHIPNVAIAIIDNNKLVETKVYGNSTKREPAPKDMIFEVASLTKVVFSTMVLRLVDEGKWSLDEPISTYFIDPEVAADPYSKKLSTRHVLSQQSGFDNWRWMNQTGKLQFNFEPGTRFNYSGEGMEYLKTAIERKFNTQLSFLADSILFKPLGMLHTNHEWDGKKDFDRHSRMYDTDGKEIIRKDYSIRASAAAGLTTTIGDLAKFGMEVLNGAHLSGKLYNEMVKTQANINPNLQQGLGWRVINGLPNGEYALQHGGNDPGLAAIIVLLPKSKRGVIVLSNGDNGLILCNNIVRAVLSEGKEIIHKAYKSTGLNEEPTGIKLSENTLNSYVGNYKREDDVPVTVSRSNSGLVLNMAGIPTLNLIPESEERFFLRDLDAKVFFTKDKDNKVNSVSIQDGENVIKCVKVFGTPAN